MRCAWDALDKASEPAVSSQEYEAQAVSSGDEDEDSDEETRREARALSMQCLFGPDFLSSDPIDTSLCSDTLSQGTIEELVPVDIDRMVGPGTLSIHLTGDNDYWLDDKNISEQLVTWRREQVDNESFLTDHDAQEILSLNFIFDHHLVKRLQEQERALWSYQLSENDHAFILQVPLDYGRDALKTGALDTGETLYPDCMLTTVSSPQQTLLVAEVKKFDATQQECDWDRIKLFVEMKSDKYQYAQVPVRQKILAKYQHNSVYRYQSLFYFGALRVVCPPLLAAQAAVTSTMSRLTGDRKRKPLKAIWTRGTYNAEPMVLKSSASPQQQARELRQEARGLRQDTLVNHHRSGLTSAEVPLSMAPETAQGAAISPPSTRTGRLLGEQH
ncbi:hypothetical protein BGZ73_004282 [Actinomortierella ambigua]|nr:hypothetical protein BGZ73_004282 [Actinomortierella ambigua]